MSLRWAVVWVLGCDPSTVSTPSPSTPSPAPVPVPPCAGSTPIVRGDGTASGYERCADGRIHRVSAVPAVVPGLGNACTGAEAASDLPNAAPEKPPRRRAVQEREAPARPAIEAGRTDRGSASGTAGRTRPRPAPRPAGVAGGADQRVPRRGLRPK